MLWPLLVMALGFTLFFATLLLIRMRTLLIAAKARALRLSSLGEGSRIAVPHPATTR
jgi:heme exporter protein C